MSSKEFIKKQVEKFSSSLTPEQFTELSESENSLIILEVSAKDYTLTEIARLIESNNAHVLSLAVMPLTDGSSLLISIKLDVSDLTPVLRSFERFDYKVIYYYMKEGEINDKQRDRLNELLYYLDM
ncbi:hypothetical protein [Seramator thermalis]|jgi:hypothetical protein|uniref:hypothetical protein n=1 Tax=Seramator thermalis TaxID=2496270 RepID=UPI0009C7F9D4|nr:hypothetical protein [Seramator thermalis]MBP9031801.1 hypothetical protein [Dysgonamonadaceae bacterium]MBZ4657530.1 hypothetical protein [Methermicoccus sp.]MDK2838032.1 hypothetical protein [Bacteroidota bacterium]OPZ15643.1 MAG: hypothetical protein BWZ06_00027 [Bacteroidetes bacterium ADurb.BinA261]MBZ4674618.1 hypothetical protein [Dysgonamonadaceae bacterium]